MESKIIEAIAGTSSAGFLLCIVYIVYINVKYGKATRSMVNDSKNNININTEQAKTADYLINTLQQVNSKLESIQTQLHELEQKQNNYSKAFKIYVDNNGVENSVKNAIKRVIEGD
ncbi:hypothetical protein [Mycoplasma sp. VS30B]